MIAISYTTFFIIYIYGWLIYLSILWFREAIRNNKYDWDSNIEEKLFVCDACHYTFISDIKTLKMKCPRCGNIFFIKKKNKIKY